MKMKDSIIAVRIEPTIRKRFQTYCKANESTMSQELRRSIKRLLGIIQQATPSDGNAK